MKNSNKENVEKYTSYSKLHPNPKNVFSKIGLLFKPKSADLGVDTSYYYFILETIRLSSSVHSDTVIYFNQDRYYRDMSIEQILNNVVENRAYDVLYNKHMDLSDSSFYEEIGYEKDLRKWPSSLLSEKYKALCKAMDNDLLTSRLDTTIKSILNAPEPIRKELFIKHINWLRFMSPLDNLGDRLKLKKRT